ncbi:MAG: NAD(P)H-dependent oxidoreductase subunit E [Bacillota bacterium]
MERCNGLALSDPRFAELDHCIRLYDGRADAILYVLERARCLFGGLPNQVLHHIAHGLSLPYGDVYLAASFQEFFTARPPAAHTVTICMCTRCYLAGNYFLLHRLSAELAIGPGETTPDDLFTLTVSYGGEGDDEPGFLIDGQRFTVRPDEVEPILDSFRETPHLTKSQ